MDYLKSWGFLIIPIVSALITISGVWATFGVRLSGVEARQDRQGTAITNLQDADKGQVANYAELKAKVDIMIDDIRYIRSRIDRATQ